MKYILGRRITHVNKVVFGVYPGDVDLSLGSYIARTVPKTSVGIVDFSLISPYETDPTILQASQAAELLGAKWRCNFELPLYGLIHTASLKGVLLNVVKRAAPEVVILPPFSGETALHSLLYSLAAEVLISTERMNGPVNRHLLDSPKPPGRNIAATIWNRITRRQPGLEPRINGFTLAGDISDGCEIGVRYGEKEMDRRLRALSIYGEDYFPEDVLWRQGLTPQLGEIVLYKTTRKPPFFNWFLPIGTREAEDLVEVKQVEV